MKLVAGGILADAGDHLIDALLSDYPGRVAVEVGIIQSQTDPGIDLVTDAAIRFGGWNSCLGFRAFRQGAL